MIEYNKQYYESNQDKVKEQSKQYRNEHKNKINEYRELNKDKIKESKQQWYIKNKALMSEETKTLIKDINNERGSQPYTCECGLTIRYDSKTKHFKSKKHQLYIQKIII